ncbi:glutamate dehydrogenase [Marinicauda pacifica]|uniref:NAD-glutamate dehydrogenase n=1 Tax=Marinicauda pacifica TaxID=1133559 RepID=A0A4S2HB53_9PROT|nr:NAD-glutamate dehydrogenase [Marinicauda pacifica]TGY93144.1 NAD-glutamate dehydrogenase [Marinicauda pacifica]GGE43222.1 glutamate dehydrogenase [Marinicauda pacifica]
MNAVVSVAHAYERETFLKEARKRWKAAYGEPGPEAESFLTQIWSDALAEDLQQIALDDLLNMAEQFWTFAGQRPSDKILVRVRPAEDVEGNAIGRDILEVVSRDRPFLVDSVMGEISSMALDVRAMFHPIVQIRRDEDGDRVESGGRVIAESMIQVHLEPLDEASRAQLTDGVLATLCDVRAAVDDWTDMRAQMDEAIDHLKNANTKAPREEVDEALDFLAWLRDNHFAFLGCRAFEFDVDESGQLRSREPIVLNETGRGVLRDPDVHVLRKSAEPSHISEAVESFLRAPSPVIVAKANLKSRVHRRVYMDYIGVKRYREDGVVLGETRFVGLFTAEAYDQMARDVPLIRRKVRRVLEKAAKTPGSHSAKKLQNIVENYPRDELFQTTEEDLLEISLGILHLFDRPRTKLFLRRDQFDRFVSCLLFVPRERYSSRVRQLAGEVLREAFDGRLSAFYPNFGDGPLARVHFIIGLEPFEHPEPDPLELEQAIAALTRTWEDELETAAWDHADSDIRSAVKRYIQGYSAGYRERFAPDEALADIERMEMVSGEMRTAARAYRLASDSDTQIRVKLYRLGQPVSLSSVLPVLENLGVHVEAEAGYGVKRMGADGETETVWVHEFDMHSDFGPVTDVQSVASGLEDAILAVLDGRAEDDGFNRLILSIGISWREAAFLRTCARYRQQTGLDPSQVIQEEALTLYSTIARHLLEYAATRFDPSLGLDMKAREERAKEIAASVRKALEDVSSLDHDKVLRRMLRLLEGTLRTNFYQRGENGQPKPWISLKIASKDLRELPEPKPYREIFVWSPRVEGVHIRFGPVARGGLRWSDRREDFRTEVLGLVKAQQVKNAVIVPVGSKGGFYPKQLPRGGDREAWLAEGKEAYKTFLRGLLDITDNIVDDTVDRPDDVVCWDDEDPYLVVAADKGTATFSDLANSVAQTEYDFWLGDAFASGGSAGYDHKKMGITAKGAWVSVQRHFREMGKDIQTEPFTVLGVGDMSGDVFGNGMLLSKQIRLVAAFDHRDIFIDPNPQDPDRLWEERKRMFELPRSSWQDYDQTLISQGGGIFPRSAKSITLTDEIRKLTGLKQKAVSPSDLISALLKMKVELIWFGGIGTYVKASTEQNWEVGDKANDALRIDAKDMRAAVIGEGANLGVTQAARIEFSRKGGRCNADFIDNSAGVDSSDHEVNIKILLNPIVRDGRMELADRNALLERMTDDVARHVLQHNYDQSLALTIAQAHASEDVDAHERMMERLEKAGRLDRKVEGLPTPEAIRQFKDQSLGLARPEIAILLSYAKLSLFDRLVASGVPDDPHFEHTLVSYFPQQLEDFSEAMQGHRLKREIIATRLTNDMVNLGGPTFVHRAMESTGAEVDAIARAFEAGRHIFRFKDYIKRINELDNKAPASVQLALYDEVIRLMRRQTYWLARRGRGVDASHAANIDDVVATYQPGVDSLKTWVADIISDHETQGVKARYETYVEEGAPEDLAMDVARLRPLTSSSDVIDLALTQDWPLEAVARLYHAVGRRFSFDRLRGVGSQLSSTLHWDRLAMRRLIEDLYASQQTIVSAMIAHARKSGGQLSAGAEAPDGDWASAVVDAWQTENESEVDRADGAVEELTNSGAWTLSKVAIASTQLRELAVQGR